MRDPIKAFEEIKKGFELYVKTRFATQFPSIERKREEIFEKEGVFYREPWVELIRKYKSSGKKISHLNENDLNGFSRTQIKEFQDFAQSGLVGTSLFMNISTKCSQKVLKEQIQSLLREQDRGKRKPSCSPSLPP